jgi:hypothetical protein
MFSLFFVNGFVWMRGQCVGISYRLAPEGRINEYIKSNVKQVQILLLSMLECICITYSLGKVLFFYTPANPSSFVKRFVWMAGKRIMGKAICCRMFAHDFLSSPPSPNLDRVFVKSCHPPSIQKRRFDIVCLIW